MVEASLQNMSDPAVVSAIGGWRQDALAEAYRRHARAVFGLCRRLLTDPVLAEEVVQEVFFRLWRAPQHFDPQRGALRSYLLSQAHGRALDLLRAEASRRQREQREARQTAPAGYDLEREVWNAAMAEQVKQALAELPTEERRAIELAYFGGHTYRQVAAVLGEPEGTIKSRIRTGLRRLRGGLSAAGVVPAWSES